MKLNTLPADIDKPCNACHRVHRKLYLYQGYWMGKNCLFDYETYNAFPSIKHPAWIGYEKNYAKIQRMVTA